MDVNALEQLNVKLRKLPKNLLTDVEDYIDFLIFKTQNETTNVPEWQKIEVRKRLKKYRDNPDIAMDFDKAMDEIEKRL